MRKCLSAFNDSDIARMFFKCFYSAYFYEKQSDFVFNASDPCDPQPGLTSLAFRSREMLGYMKELDKNIAFDPNGLFPLLFSKCAAILVPKISAIFRILIRNGSFPVCWRLANVTPIPKASSSSFISDYRPISVTPLLSMFLQRLLAKRLSHYIEYSKYVPPG